MVLFIKHCGAERMRQGKPGPFRDGSIVRNQRVSRLRLGLDEAAYRGKCDRSERLLL